MLLASLEGLAARGVRQRWIVSSVLIACLLLSFVLTNKHDGIQSLVLDRFGFEDSKASPSRISENGLLLYQEPHWFKVHDWDSSAKAHLPPNKCMTYKERYAGYDKPLKLDYFVPRPGIKQALMVRCDVRPFVQQPMSQDFMTAWRAGIVEIEQHSGMDVWFLLHYEGSQAEYEELTATIPPEFAVRMVPFDWQSAVQPFPKAEWDNIIYHNQVSLNYFMDLPEAQQYEMVWWCEWDARIVGGTWSHFFGLVNASIPQTYAQARQPARWSTHWSTDPTPADMDLYKPDFIQMGKLFRMAEDMPRVAQCLEMYDSEHLVSGLLDLAAVSRRLHEKMKESYHNNRLCYFEEFIPTVAKENQLSMLEIEMPKYESTNSTLTHDTWHCCGTAGPEYYRSWLEGDSICREGPTPLHPYKY